MAQLAISSSDPSDGASDVFVNIALEVTFDSAVASSTVSQNTCVLTDQATDEVLDTTVELLSDGVTVRLTPTGILAEDTVYRITFPGTDTAISASYVLKDDSASEALSTTLTITFTTGSRVYINDTSVDKNAGDLSLEGDLNLPTNVKALGELVISSVVPKNHTADVSLDLGGDNSITFTFDNSLDSVTFAESWFNVDVFSVMDDATYIVSGQSIPGHAITFTGAVVDVTFSGDLPNNVGVQITLEEDITDEDGNEYGPNSYLYSITTERNPSIAGTHVLRREIKAAADELTDDYMASVLYAKTVEFESRWGIPASPNIAMHKWIVNSAIVDILDDKELEKAIAAGTRRQLGDMNVSVDPIIGKLSLKHARALKKLEDLARLFAGKNIIAQNYSNYHYGDISRSYRRWYGVSGRLMSSKFITYQGDSPGANSALNRGSKIAPGNDWWF